MKSLKLLHLGVVVGVWLFWDPLIDFMGGFMGREVAAFTLLGATLLLVWGMDMMVPTEVQPPSTTEESVTAAFCPVCGTVSEPGNCDVCGAEVRIDGDSSSV